MRGDGYFRIGRRVAAVGVLLFGLMVLLLPVAFLVDHGQWPPTRVNVVLWLDPDHEECDSEAIQAERAPMLGTGVSMADICPNSKYSPSRQYSRSWDVVWWVVGTGVPLLVAGLLWLPRQPFPDAVQEVQR
jgi:hypothetical protein